MISDRELLNTFAKDRKKFIILMSLYCMLFIFRDVLGYSVSNVIFIALSSLMFILFDVDECVAFVASFIILGGGVQTALTLGIGLIIILFKKRKYFKMSYLIIPIFLMVIWEFFHATIIPFSLYEYIKNSVFFVLLAILVFDKGVRYDNKLILHTFSVITIFTLFVILLQYLEFYNYSLQSLFASGIRFGNVDVLTGTEQMRLSNNSNYIGQVCAIAIASVITLFNYFPRKRLMFIVEIFVLAIFGFMTQSRTFIFLFILVITYGILASYKFYGKSIIQALPLLIFSGLSLIIILTFVLPDILNSIIQRFSVDDVTGGRMIILRQYNQLIFHDLRIFFFGIGLQDIRTKINAYPAFGITNSPHNALQEILLCWGIVGIILFFIMLYFLILNAAKSRKGRGHWLNYYVLIVFLVAIQASQLIRLNERNLIFILAYCCLTLEKGIGKMYVN